MTATASSLSSFKSTFNRTTTVLRWLGTNGLRFFLQWWFAKRPMFWIPRGWLPGYVEWALAFPRAPRGSVSIQIWGIACATVVQLIATAVVAGLMLWGQGTKEKRKEKMAMKGEKEVEKKEL